MFTKEEAYSTIADLIERFSFQIDSYKKSDYNETQIKKNNKPPLPINSNNLTQE
jgi:hypothetical protein